MDMSAGSLGNGLSVGVGMALSGKLHHQDYMTYVMLGDGEIQEVEGGDHLHSGQGAAGMAGLRGVDHGDDVLPELDSLLLQQLHVFRWAAPSS